MRDELLAYYERELTFIRRMSAEFAQKYPKIAGRLLLEPGKCEDPHVERLIEAFALLAARIHLKIDDEFPEITQALLQVLYPHYLAPVPSMSIVQFELDPDQGKISTGYTIEPHRTLYARAARDTVCRFRTCYPVTLWPIEVRGAELQAEPGETVLTLKLGTVGDARFSELEIDRLRFFLSGEGRFAYALYEALMTTCSRVEIRNLGNPERRLRIELPGPALRDVGFEKEEGLLPYSNRSFLGYRLLQEYLHFPEKFLFFDVRNLEALRRGGFERDVALCFVLDRRPRIEQAVEARNFCLGCTPVVNLFQQVAEPIHLDHAHAEYRVIPDVRRQSTTEVYSIDSVTSITPQTGAVVEYRPFYALKHTLARQQAGTFWHASRRPSTASGVSGTEVYLTLVDLHFRPARPPAEIVTVKVTCTNRDLPGMLPFGHADGDFDLEGAAVVRRATCLTKPTRTLRPPLGHAAQWRLISHLSLNYLSLISSDEHGRPEVLQEILRLYNFADEPSVQQQIDQQIDGITVIRSRQVLRRVRIPQGSGFARGIEVTVEFDETHYVGSGMYLLSSVLEKFFGLYVSINSFSETVTVSQQRGVVARGRPRAGQQVLL